VSLAANELYSFALHQTAHGIITASFAAFLHSRGHFSSVLTTTSTQGRNKQPNLKAQIDLAYFGNTELEIMIAFAHSSSNYVHVHDATLFCDGTHALTSLQITRATIHGLRTSVTKLIDRAM
jgi:hypothetical protein